ncbi:MAG: peptidylprolyl isomerase [Christensenellales bacterium]
MYVESKDVTDSVKIEMENGDCVVVRLFDEIAPVTVKNFQKLVKNGFYDGLIFHRVISGFMIQGGDPLGNGTGGSSERIKGEFLYNGVKNNLSHERGVISMARAQHPDSASSQFFICHADAKFLDGQYAAFGKVTEGMETVDKIAAVATDYNDRPLIEQKMKRVYFVKEA